MEEDDSQDELINRSTSHSKGKNAASWAISDDSDDIEEESEEGESDDSGDEAERDGEEEEEGEEEVNQEEDDEEEEDEAKPEQGAFGEASVDLAGMSSDEDSEKCPICLNSFSSQPVATPENCEHYFCFDCILEWAKNSNSCPVDRMTFDSIYLRTCFAGKVQKMITVQKPVKEVQQETIDLTLEQTNCEVCRGSDREDRLLLCDGCDAGYHMECLTPPLDAVPVEEWFCPECVANNHHTRRAAEEISDAESLPSTTRFAISQSQSRAAGPTRAIARTQQSERVRANVNRHRITQARTSQLAPTYLIQSTWLDETINAVVAGLNTAVYVRDFTSHVPSRHRRTTGRRRMVRSRKTSSAKGKNGKSGSTRVKRRKRKVRRTKSRKNLIAKKAATSRSRIASSLGIAKDKKGSSLPTVYRPSENTLSNMRADIGAASLSIYGDPSDLDPFVDREEDEQQNHITSLLEAKRRGISRSALRSHQPVARPFTASLSRRSMGVAESGGVVEAAPMPDLLGSILTGQSMLLMDSSDVVINRDGSLNATKPIILSSAVKPGGSISRSSGDSCDYTSTGIEPNLGDCLSPHYNRDLPGSSNSTPNRPFSQSPSLIPPFTPSSASSIQPRGHLSSQPPSTNRSILSPGLQGTNGVGARRSSMHPTPEPGSKSKAMVPPQSQTKKAPTKPMWVDVSVLPRIPKIKRESSGVINDVACGNGDTDKSSSSKGSSSNSTTSNGYGMPETGMNSLAGDKKSQQRVSQQQGRAGRQAHRPRSDAAGSSSAFSNSFSSSSSSTGSPSTQPCHSSSSSSSSSAISFRINSSGNSWHSRRLSITSSSASGGSVQSHRREKPDEARKRQLHRDKQMLLASRTLINMEQDSNNIYDPFNPTLSDSGSSDSEGEGSSLESRSQQVSLAAGLGNRQRVVQSQQELVHVKTESQEREISQEELRRASPQETVPQAVRCPGGFVKVEKESRLVDVKIEKPTASTGIKVKQEPGLEDEEEAERCGYGVNRDLRSETPDITSPVHDSMEPFKTENETQEEESDETPDTSLHNHKKHSSASCSASNKKKEIRSDCRSPSRDLGHQKKTSKKDVSSKQQGSSSSETDRGRRGDHHASDHGGRQKQRDKEKSSRRSRSRERKRTRSPSDSSRSNSPERSHRKRRRSQSKDRRRSRSSSSSSSRERSRRIKPKRSSHDRTDGSERHRERRPVQKDKRHCRSQSKSRSKSRSRSRSRERRKDHTRSQQSSLSARDKEESRSKDKRRHRSRSSSRERRNEEGSSKSSEKPSRSIFPSSKERRDKKKEKDIPQSSLKEEHIERVNKQDMSCFSSASKVKKEGEDVRTDRQSTSADILKERKFVKDIKKEEQFSVDVFEDVQVDKQATSADNLKERKFLKGIKKEKQSSEDVFEDLKANRRASSADILKERKFVIEIKKEKQSSEDVFDDLWADRRATSADILKERKFVKDLKKEEQSSVDVFEDVQVDKQVTSADLLKERKFVKDIKKEKQSSEDVFEDLNANRRATSADILKERKFVKDLKKEEQSSVDVFEDLNANRQTSSAGFLKERKFVKEIKKEKQSSEDVFEDFPITKPIKKEEAPLIIAEGINKEEIKIDPIKIETCVKFKAETCEITTIKSEPTSPEVLAAAASLQDSVSLSYQNVKAPVDQPDSIGLSVPLKKEIQQPSDSDDDFNVDVMLDNLDNAKREHAEGSGVAVKQEKDGQKGMNEGAQVSAIVGAKSKTQGKRVTWNIQEPDRAKTHKSASKLALYKLKLKQEGASRPSSTGSTASEDISAPGCVSKKGGVGLLSTSCSSDSVHLGGLSTSGQGEAEEGDGSRKDKYLKKLHMQERAVEEVKLAIKPFYQRRDINKDEYKDILRKAVQKVCHSKSGEINPVKVGNLVKAYVDKYKHARKHRKGEDLEKGLELDTEPMSTCDSP